VKEGSMGEKWPIEFCLQQATSIVNVEIFYMPQSYDMGQTALLPLRRKACLPLRRKACIRKWQSQWEEITKGTITKDFFSPNLERRLEVNLDLTPNVTAIMNGHGNIRSYLHRLKIIDSPERPCKQNIQTVDHLVFQCERLKYERGMLKNSVLKAGNWPISKSELVNKNLKQFICYINSMDLEKLNHSDKEL
jgi:hypothetical protein